MSLTEELRLYQQKFEQLKEILDNVHFCIVERQAQISGLALEDFQWLDENAETLALYLHIFKFVSVCFDDTKYFTLCPNEYLSEYMSHSRD